jgi:flagellar motility protein MotE (MotC chaperone)
VKTGYDQFFKKAEQARQQEVGLRQKPLRSAQGFQLQSSDAEKQDEIIRRNVPMKSKKRKKSSFSWKLSGLSFIGFFIALYGFQNHEEIENKLRKVEISFFGIALAEEVPTAKASESAGAQAAPSSPSTSTAETAQATSGGAESVASFDHLEKLNERKKQLDAREEELNRLEAEIQAQKVEVEKRMTEVQAMRADISAILDDKVKADEQKVEVLVQVYSNMKPQQAALVFGTMDEDLAIEILGRMKKKSAADIMNLIKPDKAQVLSEKFAGYKRKPSSTANGPAKPEGEEKKQ